MRLRVIPDCMAALCNIPRESRKRPHALPDQKKCRRSLVPFQKLQHSRRNNGIRPIIKSNRHARNIIQPPQSTPEKLRSRRQRPPRKEPTRGTHPARPEPNWIDRHHPTNLRTHPSRMPTIVENLSCAATLRNLRHAALAAPRRLDGLSPFDLLRCPRSRRQNAHHSINTTPKNPRLVPLPRSPLARRLVRRLLARLGSREFPPSLRHRRNPHLHRPLYQQRATHLEPSRLLCTY